MVDRILNVAGWIVSTFLAYLYGRELARRQKAEADAAARQAYLENLREEFAANQRILEEMSKHVDGGPAIPEILGPADVAASHLRFTAWDALIRAGVLANLMPAEQALFRVADRAGRKAAQEIQTGAATWRRFLAWQEWTRKEGKDGKTVQLWPEDGMLRQVQGQITKSVDDTLKHTAQALARLDELLTAETKRPAS